MPDDNSTGNNTQTVEELKRYISTAEENLEAAKKALFELTGEDLTSKTAPKAPFGLRVSGDGKIIEGVFNGENMIGPEGKVFPVPANYASKSKLVEGDRLKLTVAEDGSFIFKQIGPVPRQKLVGVLQFEDNAFFVRVDGKKYKLLYAAVTYHKAKPGENVTIVVPTEGDSEWAAFENILHDVAGSEPQSPEEESILDINPQDNQDDAFKLDEGIFGNQPAASAPADNASSPTPIEPAMPVVAEEPAEPVPTPATEVPMPPPILPSEPALGTEPPAQPVPPTAPELPAEPTTVSSPQPAESPMLTAIPESADPLAPAKTPDESFLPRTQSDETNSMGEALPGAAEPADTPELEI